MSSLHRASTDALILLNIMLLFTECEENDIVMTIVANEQFLGAIEVCIHNRWHRVCDSNWTKADATVACRQLELPHTGKCSNPSLA